MPGPTESRLLPGNFKLNFVPNISRAYDRADDEVHYECNALILLPKMNTTERPKRRPSPVFIDLIKARHFVTFMLFLGMGNAYIMRTNMSIAIVAMVNHTATERAADIPPDPHECNRPNNVTQARSERAKDGKFVWSSIQQSTLLASFFYGYVVTQIPFGILAKIYGPKRFLGIGMLINSVFGLLVPVASECGFIALAAVRFIQGLGEGPIVPCTHAILAKWVPPNERSRLAAFVYAGAQLGTTIAMPVSGYLSASDFCGGWPSIFYIFGAVGAIWSVWFLAYVHESPASHPKIAEEEKRFIQESLSGAEPVTLSEKIPWGKISRSAPFWGILAAHMAQNYGYETLLTQMPTFMHQVLKFDIQSNGLNSAIPYVAMGIFSTAISFLADYAISKKLLSVTVTRKVSNCIGQYGPAICLVMAAYTGCNVALTVLLLSLGLGMNGAIYSGFKVNHLDISPKFAGVLMSLTNCLGNLAGLFAPNVAGVVINKRPTQAAWRVVFCIAAAVYAMGATVFVLLASGKKQPWDSKADHRGGTKAGSQDGRADHRKRTEAGSWDSRVDHRGGTGSGSKTYKY